MMAKRKSSYSGQNGHCVEIESLPCGEIAITDSKREAGPCLQIDRPAFGALLGAIKSGRFPIAVTDLRFDDC